MRLLKMLLRNISQAEKRNCTLEGEKGLLIKSFTRSNMQAKNLLGLFATCIFLALAAAVGPSGPTQPGAPADCVLWYSAKEGDTASEIATSYNIQLETFLGANPQLSGDPELSLWKGYDYCVPQGSKTVSQVGSGRGQLMKNLQNLLTPNKSRQVRIRTKIVPVLNRAQVSRTQAMPTQLLKKLALPGPLLKRTAMPTQLLRDLALSRKQAQLLRRLALSRRQVHFPRIQAQLARSQPRLLSRANSLVYLQELSQLLTHSQDNPPSRPQAPSRMQVPS